MEGKRGLISANTGPEIKGCGLAVADRGLARPLHGPGISLWLNTKASISTWSSKHKILRTHSRST